MPGMKVTNTHGLGIDDIAKPAARAEKPYTRQALTAVVMTLQGISAKTIAQPAIPRSSSLHQIGGQSSFAEEMPGYRRCG